jgi:hypothetical protein
MEVNMFDIEFYDLDTSKEKELPKNFKMEKIIFSNELPDNLTFPESSKIYFETVKNKKGF